jgi:MFS transporter, putative metabolite:H+ symporter
MSDTIDIKKAILALPVLVAAIGYFVDIYDIVIFGVVRVVSLRELGLSGEQITQYGATILNMQMSGMLIGGVIWGVLGDKIGRLKVLFGSIAIYSIANLLNAFVTSVEQYEAARFFAGLGLAGELGAGVTLTLELLPKEIRGYGVMMIAGLGVTGAIAANLVSQAFDWRTAYIIGGVLGFVLLALRFKMSESVMFDKIKDEASAKKGDFLSIFRDKNKLSKYAKSIASGLPLWFCVGILVVFSPEIAVALGVDGNANAGNAVMACYIGLTFGDFISGYLSQKLKSRRGVTGMFTVFAFVMFLVYINMYSVGTTAIYTACFFIGLACGYWVVFITICAEQFGTNLRSTVASTVPNFVRGAVVPMSMSFVALKSSFGVLGAAFVVGIVVFTVAFIAIYLLEETYHKELDYIEI